MLRKEIGDAFKKLVESLVVLVVIPSMYLGDKLIFKWGLDYASLIDTGFVITLVFYAVYAGGTVFQSERKDRAFEYLFSLPLTRGRIILAKILPRLGLLSILGLAAAVVVGRGLLTGAGVTVLVLFFSSMFLSIAVSSIALNLFGVGLMYAIFFQVGRVFTHLLSKTGGDYARPLYWLVMQAIPAAVLLIPFSLAFWLTFRKMDARPLKLQMKIYYAITLPTLFILVLLIALFSKRYLAGI